MRTPILFMYSGQGSQYYHMGKELYRQNAVFRHYMSELNNIVYDNSGISVIDEIYNSSKTKADKFDDILYTHPAIFMVEYSLTMVLVESGIEPDCVLGASLGEFAAATVSGVTSPEQALRCIIKQAELIRSHCQAGSMVTIMHNPELYKNSREIHFHSELAAVNYSSHFVISGKGEDLSNVELYLKHHDIPYFTLPVQYGFHSSNVDPAEGEYVGYLSTLAFGMPRIPIISCLYGGLQLSDIVPRHFWDVVRKPIRFQDAVQKICDTQFNYIDLGPFGTLASFIKHNLGKDFAPRVFDVLTPFDQEIKKLASLMKV